MLKNLYLYNMRIVCISDTHGLHTIMEQFKSLPEGDILIHAGDCTNVGKPHEVTEFVYWFQNVKGFDTKIFIAGNHDFAFEKVNEPHHNGDFDWFKNLMNEENLSQSDVVYLQDNEFVIESPEFSKPLKIYGSPWQPEFYNWAFNLPRNGWELELKWKDIPEDTDILITHGPPHGVRDFTPANLQVGCEILRFHVENRIKPSIHVFGHIHQAYGAVQQDETMYVNASICTERYIPSNKPIIIDITEENGKLIATYVENN
jgi:Icc-related predicted phosphoesterase